MARQSVIDPGTGGITKKKVPKSFEPGSSGSGWTIGIKTRKPRLTKVEQRAEEKAKLATLRDKNRIRLFKLMERIGTMKLQGVYNVSFDYVDQMSITSFSDSCAPGLRIHYRAIRSSLYDTAKNTEEDATSDLHLESEDWEFETVEEGLKAMVQRHLDEEALEKRKASLVRRMPKDERDLLYPNWHDPYPDDAIHALSEAIVSAKSSMSMKQRRK